jgi:hypothetical protein
MSTPSAVRTNRHAFLDSAQDDFGQRQARVSLPMFEGAEAAELQCGREVLDEAAVPHASTHSPGSDAAGVGVNLHERARAHLARFRQEFFSRTRRTFRLR